MAPAGTPQPVIDKLNAAAQRVLDAPATRERLAALAAQPMGGTPQALAQHLQTEREKYRVLIEGTDIRPE
jgi:tripartite-type tricarboxylate transporter receptor subunit TctC